MQREIAETKLVVHKALSLTQPWLSGGILAMGKRIENRTAWRDCNYRGPLWLHASATTGVDFDMAARGLREIMLASGDPDVFLRFETKYLTLKSVRAAKWQSREPRYAPTEALPMGAIVGRCVLDGVISSENEFKNYVERGPGGREARARREKQRMWWFGGFALVLDEVVPIEPVPCKGALGLWTVSADVIELAEAALAKAVAA